MSLLIVSDLHIQNSRDPLYRSLLKLLESRAGSGVTLVLAGDIFDLFVGNKRVFVKRYRELFSALQAAGARGAEIHYIEGNHDFMIGRAFGNIPGVSVHTEEVSLEIGGRKFLVAHGDLADARDYGYRLLRAVFRSPFMKAFVTLSPDAVIDWIGKTSSQYSRALNPVLSSDLPVERRDRLRTVYRGYAAERLAEGYDFVVLGHCHDLDEMTVTIENKIRQYKNVGFPRIHGTFLSWSEKDNRMERVALP